MAADSIFLSSSLKCRPGEIPKYLQERKAEWTKDQEEKRRLELDPDCPPNHVPLSEAGRSKLLAALRAKHDALSHKVQMLPMTSTTLRTRAYREQLQEDMLQVESAIRHFTVNKVRSCWKGQGFH